MLPTINNLESLSSVRITINENFLNLYTWVADLSSAVAGLLSPTATPEPTPEPTSSPTPEPTNTPPPTGTPEATPEPTSSATPEPTGTPEATPGATPEPTPTATTPTIAADLTITNENDTSSYTFTGLTNIYVDATNSGTPDVDWFTDNNNLLDPLKFSGGGSVTDLTLYNVYVAQVMTPQFDNNMPSLTALKFEYTGLQEFNLTDTSNISNVTKLDLLYLGYIGTGFFWTDMSGMSNLAELDLTYSGYLATTNISDTVTILPSNVTELILDAAYLGIAGVGGTGSISLKTDTITTNITNRTTDLQNSGWTVSITT